MAKPGRPPGVLAPDEDLRLNAYSRCGECDVYYREKEFGCSVCKPAKASIKTPKGSHVLNASDAALEMLERQMDDLRYEKRRQREGEGKSVGRFDKQLMAAELNCAKALAILLEHRRKQEKKEQTEVGDMTPEEKLEVFLDMVETLPPRLIPYLEAGLKARALLSREAPKDIFSEDQ
jgi:hypothetical protein